MNQDVGQRLGDVKLSRPFRPHDAISSQDPGRCPGLRDNAPLALKEGHDFYIFHFPFPSYSLNFSILPGNSPPRFSTALPSDTITVPFTATYGIPSGN